MKFTIQRPPSTPSDTPPSTPFLQDTSNSEDADTEYSQFVDTDEAPGALQYNHINSTNITF
jgi:hypothetical protein